MLPTKMRFDYVRVYARDGEFDQVTCDPPGAPTTGESCFYARDPTRPLADYISRHPEAYGNWNLTVRFRMVSERD